MNQRNVTREVKSGLGDDPFPNFDFSWDHVSKAIARPFIGTFGRCFHIDAAAMLYYVVLSLAYADDAILGRAEDSLRSTLPPFADHRSTTA